MPEVSISDAEWQVMNVVWDEQPATAAEIVERLAGQAVWTASTIKTMLHRLVKKQVLAFEQQANRYVYRARVKRSACVSQASRSFLDRVFDGDSAPLLAHFLRTSKLTANDIANLRQILDQQENKT